MHLTWTKGFACCTERQTSFHLQETSTPRRFEEAGMTDTPTDVPLVCESIGEEGAGEKAAISPPPSWATAIKRLNQT